MDGGGFMKWEWSRRCDLFGKGQDLGRVKRGGGEEKEGEGRGTESCFTTLACGCHYVVVNTGDFRNSHLSASHCSHPRKSQPQRLEVNPRCSQL